MITGEDRELFERGLAHATAAHAHSSEERAATASPSTCRPSASTEPGGSHRAIAGSTTADVALDEGRVEGGAVVAVGRGPEAALEQLEVLAGDHGSFPRSSRRRAMMLRWISALPP